MSAHSPPAAPRALPLSVTRMLGLETAVGMLGTQARLAEALGIDPRSLRAKLNADRGVSDADLRLAADALDARAVAIAAHATKLRALAPPRMLPVSPSPSPSPETGASQ